MNTIEITHSQSIPDTFTFTSCTTIQSEHATKYLNVLCRHFSRKVDAQWDDHQGIVNFTIGITSMKVKDRELHITCHAKNEALLEDQKSIINHHVVLFARREVIDFKWS